MLPTRYTRKEGRGHLAQQLVDAHVIGLNLDEDFQYDMAAGTGASPYKQALIEVSLAERIGKNPLPEAYALSEAKHAYIKNYIIFSPSGIMGSKIFLHGKDIFTPETARQFFEEGKRGETLFKPEAVRKMQQLLMPESFYDRMMDFDYLGYVSPKDSIKHTIRASEKMFPGIDFSALEKCGSPIKFAQTYVAILEKNGIDIAEVIERTKSDWQTTSLSLREKIADIMPGRLNAYLSGRSASAQEAQNKKKYGNELKRYMAANNWDWEILRNFEAAAPLSHPTLEALLKEGANMRSVKALSDLAETMHNPYDERFAQVEKGVAKIVADSVQPVVLKHALRDNTAMLFTSSISLFGFENEFATAGIQDGQYLPHVPASKYCDNFLFFSDENLAHARMAWAARHELEHKVDMDFPSLFARRFNTQIPSMIAADIHQLEKVERFLQNIAPASPAEDIHRLQVLGKKRGLKTKSNDIEPLKAGLLEDIEHIKDRLAVFAPQFEDRRDEETRKAYSSLIAQRTEIPPIIEELKGQFGRKFIADLLPQLSKATDLHRSEALGTASTNR